MVASRHSIYSVIAIDSDLSRAVHAQMFECGGGRLRHVSLSFPFSISSLPTPFLHSKFTQIESLGHLPLPHSSLLSLFPLCPDITVVVAWALEIHFHSSFSTLQLCVHCRSSPSLPACSSNTRPTLSGQRSYPLNK